MDESVIRKISDRVRESHFIIPIYWFIVIGFIACTVRSVFDFYTSYVGVSSMQVQGFSNQWADILNRATVAAMPQVWTNIAALVLLALEPTNRTEQWIRWGAGLTMLVAIYVDVLTGYYFYFLEGTAAGSTFHSLIMSGVADTLLSEGGWTVCFGLLLALRVDYLSALQRAKRQVVGRPSAQSRQLPRQAQPGGPA